MPEAQRRSRLGQQCRSPVGEKVDVGVDLGIAAVSQTEDAQRHPRVGNWDRQVDRRPVALLLPSTPLYLVAYLAEDSDFTLTSHASSLVEPTGTAPGEAAARRNVS